MTRLLVSTVLGFYAERMKREGVVGGQSGAVVVVQRTSADLTLCSAPPSRSATHRRQQPQDARRDASCIVVAGR